MIRASYGRIRGCYTDGLEKKSDLGGKVTIRFTIDADGSVRDVSPICTSLPDPITVSCIVNRFGQLKFPRPSGDGTVTVSYPIHFAPAD